MRDNTIGRPYNHRYISTICNVRSMSKIIVFLQGMVRVDRIMLVTWRVWVLCTLRGRYYTPYHSPVCMSDYLLLCTVDPWLEWSTSGDSAEISAKPRTCEWSIWLGRTPELHLDEGSHETECQLWSVHLIQITCSDKQIDIELMFLVLTQANKSVNH